MYKQNSISSCLMLTPKCVSQSRAPPTPPPRFELWDSSLGVVKENWTIMGMIDANHTGTEAPASLKCLHTSPSFRCSVSAVSPRSRGNRERAFLSMCRFYLTDLSQSSLNVFIKIAKSCYFMYCVLTSWGIFFLARSFFIMNLCYVSAPSHHPTPLV